MTKLGLTTKLFCARARFLFSKTQPFLRSDELSVSSETFSLKGWVGGFLPLLTDNFSSFPPCFLAKPFFPPSKQFSSYILNWSYQATPFSPAESGRCWQRAEGAEPFPGEKRIAATFQRCVFISDFISRFFRHVTDIFISMSFVMHLEN